MPALPNRLLQVPVLSSMASRPLPSAIMAREVAIRFGVSMNRSFRGEGSCCGLSSLRGFSQRVLDAVQRLAYCSDDQPVRMTLINVGDVPFRIRTGTFRPAS